jgi:phenylalanyl-tRNA synthetase beta chain
MLGEADLLKLGAGYEPVDVALEKYREFSLFPFALRDVAVWTPSGTEESEVIAVILKEAGEHVARIDLFDRFEKEGRTSYAFRLVFESFTKTLSDEELVPAMERVTVALNAKDGWQVR